MTFNKERIIGLRKENINLSKDIIDENTGELN